MADGQIVIDVNLDRDGFKRQVGGLKGDAGNAFSKIRDVMLGPVNAAQSIIGAVKLVGAAIDGMITSATEAARAQSILGSTLKATGAEAWTNRKQLNEYADTMSSLTLFEDEAITSMQGVLLGFKNITGDNFKKASTEILNMAQVMKMDLTSAAQAVGKALDDPINGIDSLSRQGFRFSQEQKSLLKSLVDVGDIAKAQKIIIDELATTYGGAAEAAATSATGAWAQMKKNYGEVLEAMGEMTATFLQDIVKWYSDGFDNIAKLIDQKTKALKLDKILSKLVSGNKFSIAEISKGLSAANLEWGDAIAYVNQQIVALQKAGERDPNYAATAAYEDDLNLLYSALSYLRLQQTAVGEITEAKAKQLALDEERTRRAKEAARLAAEQAALDEAYIDEISRIRAEQIAWSNEQVDLFAQVEAEKKKIREAYEKDWLSKLTDLQNDTLEEQRDAEIAYAESIGAETSSIREYYFIKIAERNEAIEKEAAEKAVEAQREAAEESRRIWDATISEITGGIDAIAEGANEIGGDAASGMVDLFSFIADLISAAAKDFMDVGQDIQLVFSLILLAGANMPALFEDVTSGVVELATMLMSALGPIFEAVMQTVLAFMPIFKPIVALVAELAKLVAPFIPVIAMIEQLWVNLSGIQVLLPILVSAVQLLANAFLWFYNDIIRPVYNFLILVFNKIYNAFANFFNSLLAAVDAIPLVELSYRMALKAETEGQLERISTAAGPAAGGVTEFTADLDDANERLRKNRTLFTKATEAAAAYQAVLTRVVDSVADFYDGLKDVGSDIAGMIVDGLTSGFDNDDFLFALEEYITQSILQAAVFTDAFMAQVADIGAKLARAIATGDTGQIEALKNQLSELYSAAAATAQTVTGAVSQAFGSYAVGTLALPQDGLIYAHAGEAVIPSGLMAEAMARGLTIAPTNALISGAQQITVNMKNVLTVDGREIASAAFRYQDDLVGAAYGG